MPQYVIEREIPNAGQLTDEELRTVSLKSLEALSSLGPQIQWLHSYVTENKLYCVYLAPDEATVQEHARRTGIPANRAGHFIYFEASPLAHYRVYDHVTYVTLRTGNAGRLGASGTIFGLYGNWYSMIVNGPPTGYAYINNT